MKDIWELTKLKIENNLSSGKGVRLRAKKHSATSSNSNNGSIDLAKNHIIGEADEIDSDDSNYEKHQERKRIIRTESKKEKYEHHKNKFAGNTTKFIICLN